MNEEDVREVMAERSASPQRYASFDPNDSITRYTRRKPSGLDRTITEQTGSSSSSVELQEIRSGRTPRRYMTRSASITSSINTMERHPTALSRIETHRTQHEGTVGATITMRSSMKDLPAFGAGKPYTQPFPEREEYVFEFDVPDDPLHAQNWPMRKKLFIGAIVAFDSLTATMGSSIFSAATTVVSTQFGVGDEVGVLGTSFFVLGYAFGPIMWAPMSELYGRRLPIIISGFGFSIFAIATATAPNLQTILISRFFGGLFGSCPLAVVGAIFADMFDNKTRGLAVAVFSATVFMGPLLAPFIGGFITDSYLGWRWTEYISAIMGFTTWGLCLIFLEETYPPAILVGKATELRRRTKNWGIHAKQEEIEVNFRELISKNVSRPFRILFTEPIVLLITIYMSFIYGLLYLFLTAYATVFQEIYGMNKGVGGLPYFGMVAGELIGFFTVVALNPGYGRKLEKTHNIPVPEWRLPVAIVGGVSFAAGLFWFGWTGWTKDIPWIVPTLSGLLTGFGIFTIFLQLLNYIIDAYLMFAASAIAANTFLRSLFGCIFPLFADYMFASVLGVKYTLTLLGCVAVLLIPMPVVFLIYGRRIRARSKMAPALDIKAGVGGAQKPSDEEAGTDTSPDPDADVDDEEKQMGAEGAAMAHPAHTNTTTNGSARRAAPPPRTISETAAEAKELHMDEDDFEEREEVDADAEKEEVEEVEPEEAEYMPAARRVPTGPGLVSDRVHPAQRQGWLEDGAAAPPVDGMGGQALLANAASRPAGTVGVAVPPLARRPVGRESERGVGAGAGEEPYARSSKFY